MIRFRLKPLHPSFVSLRVSLPAMLRIGGVFFLMGLVILGNGTIFIWRGRIMQRAQGSNPMWTGRAKQLRDAGVVIAAAGVIILLGSLPIIAQRGF